jgi:hypothetical protein
VSRDVQVRRGPWTLQWVTVPQGHLQVRPLDLPAKRPQVAWLRGVPDGLTNGDVMRRLERAITFGAEARTEIFWSEIEAGGVRATPPGAAPLAVTQ